MTVRDFRLPDLGEGLEDGDIVAWYVDVDDVIALNQTVADIETAKAVVAVPSPFAGRVVERIGEVGDTLEVGSVFVRIDTDVDAPAGASERSDGDPPVRSGHASTGLDADEEPQPLVGYGQGRVGGTRRRRRRGGMSAARSAEDASLPDAGSTAGPVVATGSDPAVPVRAKPPVRKLVKELGLDLAALAPGSGPGGIITRDDVLATSAAQTVPPADAAPADAAPADAAPAVGPGDATSTSRRKAPVSPVAGFGDRRPGEIEPIRGIRRRIVEKMETSRREIPAASCSRDADVTALWDLAHALTSQAEADGLDVRITPFAILLRATVLGLRRFPTLNARIDGREGGHAGEIHLLDEIHLGFAADTDRGLIVPNLKDAHTRSLVELAAGLAELAARARDGSIDPQDLTGGTFTVSNYGAFGTDDGEPIINHPEAGILGIGAMRERPWVHDGALAVRRVATLRLVFDHRICDGGEAGRFVTYLAEVCEDPARILLHA